MSNGFQIFGFEIKKKGTKEPQSFVPPNNDDGSNVITTFGSHYAWGLDLDNSTNLKNESELITRYRDIANYAEVDAGIDEIINEMIVYEDTDTSIKIDYSKEFNKKYSEQTRNIISEEFDSILRMLDFMTEGNDIARRWYVDGRLAYHKIIDESNTKLGIKELRWIDPTKLRKITEVKKQKDIKSGIDIITSREEYFVYNDSGFKTGEKQGLKIAKDAITWVPSGLFDATTGQCLSYLHKAIRPTNQMKMMEDAVLIYTLSRAPERRIFYIDTTDMPRTKAEEYIRQLMGRFKNKQVYDAVTGEMKDDKKHMSILEDFWLPRSNGKGTEVSVLPGGTGLVSPEMMNEFRTRLFQSLNVPISRLQPNQIFSTGRSNEISRDEVKFSKYIAKLRKRFNALFLDILRTQLILKGVTTSEEWEDLKTFIHFNYTQDNLFAEFKESEILRERLSTIQMVDPYIGRFFSQDYVYKKVMGMTDDEIAEMQKQIKKEPPPPTMGEQQ